MQVYEFLTVLIGLHCIIILPCSSLEQNNEVSSRNPTVAQPGKVTVNFGDLVIEVKPPQGREGIVNTQPIYERWENVDDVTYWESIYGSMDNIPAFEDLPDILGETYELEHVKEWEEEEDPDEKPAEISNNDHSEASKKNSPSRDDRSTSSMTSPPMTTKPTNSDRCERINPLFPSLKSYRQKREMSVSQEEEADAEEALKSDPNRTRKGRTLSLLQSSVGIPRMKSNWRSDYLFNKYGRKTFRPYKYDRVIPGSYGDDYCTDYGITGAATSAKFVDSAINTVELVNSGIAKTSEVVAGTIVNGARQLAQAKRDIIDLGQETTQTIALPSLNNAAADCTEEGVVAAVPTNIDSGLEVLRNSVLDTNSGIINAATDTAISAGITASIDSDTKADTLVGSVLDTKASAGAEIISNAVAESNIAITVEKDLPQEIPVAENERLIDLQEAEIVGETSANEEIVGNVKVVEIPVAESGIAVGSQVTGGIQIVADAEPSVGSALEVNAASEAHAALNTETLVGSALNVNSGSEAHTSVNAETLVGSALNANAGSEAHTSVNAEISTGSKAEVIIVKDHKNEPDLQVLGSSKSGIHAEAAIQSSLDAEIGLSSKHASISAASAASANVNANVDLGASKSGIHADSSVHSSSNSAMEINAHHRGGSLHSGAKSSLGVNSHLDIERSRSNYRTHENRERLRHPEECDSAEEIFDFDSEEYREFKRRFPEMKARGHSVKSGIHADAGIRKSLDTGVGIKANHGSIHAGTAASVDIDSKLNIGTSTSGVHAESGIHGSLDSSLDINSGGHGGGLHAGTKSSLKSDSHLDIGRTSSRTHGGNHRIHDDIDRNREFCDCDDYEDYLDYIRRYPDMREPDYPEVHSGIHSDAGIHNHGSTQTGTAASLNIDTNLDAGISKSSGSHAKSGNLEKNQIYDDLHKKDDVCECENSEEYREYRRRYPNGRFRADNRPLHNSRTHANAGIHTSLDSGIEMKTGHHGGGVTSGVHASSGIHSSLDAGLGLNSNAAGSHLHAGGRASLDTESRLDVGRMNSARPNERHREYQRGQDISAEYEDYDDEGEYRRFSPGRYRDHQRGVHSGIHTASGIHGSLGTEVDINAGSASGLQASAKSSVNLDSHLDIGATTSAVNSPNTRHVSDAINSGIRADAGVHTSLDTDINAAGHLHTGIKSSLAVDSHLDVGTRTNGASASRPRSEIIGDVNDPDGELGEKICEAACRGNSDFRTHDSCPHSRFQHTGRDGPSYICDNCRRQFHGEHFCPNCGEGDDVCGERLPFLSRGTIYHFDNLKQNCKRTTDSSEDIEIHSETTGGLKRYINLDANCSDQAFQQSPDCQNLDYNLQMPRDGNPVSLGIVRTHLSHGHDIALDMHDRARSLVAGGLHPYPHTASMLHFFHSKVPDDLVKLNEESELTLFGTKLLQHKLSVDHNVTPNNFLEFLNHHGFRVTGDRICRGRQKRCGGYDKFRSIDGSCNNVAHPTWGQSNRAFARILPARYSDGIHGMPVSVTGGELPNPRKLSVRLYSRSSKLDPELTLAVMQWGQTLAHDLGRQVMDQTTSGGIECCADNGKRHLPKSLQHHSCAPITISPRDKFYSIHGQRCMNFVRAMTVCREDCTLGPADQLNGATSFLDCSSMYGPDKATSDELREFSGGRMKVEFRSGRWMLPTTTNQSNFCDIWNSDDICYRTGDPRNNQNPQLVILQTMLVREHNRIADGLKALNSEWNDERIFQESRRIVIAEYQHITYNEWLPLLLGRRYVKKHGLNRTEPGMSSAYNERVNPTTIIGFTSGAFRSLHSMIEGDIGLCNFGGEVTDTLRMSDHFFRPKVIEKRNNFEHLLRGLSMQRMQAQDMNLHRELTEYLFRSRNDYGMDLAAIDIQRGRDHGVPSYNAYRKICRLEPATDFDDLSEEISWDNIEKLRRDYAHVDDIDLIVGATMENRAPGSLFGPTNRCLIGEQFYRSRVGDRYFYDNENLPHSFTPEQFHEITKVTLSRLMCDMGGAVVMVQRNAFRVISPKNPLIPCEDLPKLDLTLWME